MWPAGRLRFHGKAAAVALGREGHGLPPAGIGDEGHSSLREEDVDHGGQGGSASGGNGDVRIRQGQPGDLWGRPSTADPAARM